MSDGDPAAPIRNPQSAIRNRNWAWFFVALVVLSAAAAGVKWVYNARQRLTPEQLKAAQDLWDRAGPRDYDLEIDKVIGPGASGGDPMRDRITVEVRGGRARAGTINGRPLEARLLPDYDMPGW